MLEIVIIIKLIAILITVYFTTTLLIGIVVGIYKHLNPKKSKKKGEQQYKDWMEGRYKVERRNQKQSTGEITRIKRPTYWEVENQPKTTAEQFGKGETTRFKRPENWNEALKTKQPEIKPQEPEKILWNKEFLLSIEWKLFEDICVEYLKSRKCKANVTNIGKDDGIDLKVTNREGKLMFIGQCKAWSQPVNVKEIRELYGIMAA